MTGVMTFDLHGYLNSFTNWEPRLHQAGVSAFSLTAIEKLLLVMGRPDDKLKFAHVAGSKGKGSTCVFLAEIMRAAGYRVGLYTSPHLYSVCERIRVLEPVIEKGRRRGVEEDARHGAAPGLLEGCITEKQLADRVRFYRDDIDALRNAGVAITYYEVLTAVAASHFAAAQCDLVVLETGLGGRWDATNIFETSVCGITPIGLEHTAILGDTLAAIAGEKAGIIKAPYQRVALAPQAPEALAVLKERCALYGIMPTEVTADLGLQIIAENTDGTSFTVHGRRDYGLLRTRLPGRHQAVNAAVAVAMAEDLEMFGFLLEAESVVTGVAAASWPCRFEVFSHAGMSIVIDGAHTVESAAACAATFQAVFPGRKAVLVFGSGLDKNIKDMAAVLAPVVSSVILTRSANARAWVPDPAGAEGLFPGVPVVVEADPGKALDAAIRLAGKDGTVLVAGSIFLAAEVRALMIPV